MRMTCTAKKWGIRLQPPAIILIYENEMKGKSRQRIMPVRNFSKFSDCNRAAEQLKNNPRHKSYLEQVSLRQLEQLFRFLRGNLRGQSLAETMEQIQRDTAIDPKEDLNRPKLDDKELAKKKSIMDELFEKNQKKKDDPNFVYGIAVEFPQDEQLQSCGWDTESADKFGYQNKKFIGLAETPCSYRECRLVLEKSVKNTKCLNIKCAQPSAFIPEDFLAPIAIL
ncbi:PREDICTED: LOW QUALITY PROTEIN: centrosomal protein of 19 kDa-like [Myotis davidii]|uniref:LOW QUALITY PROTEIN: centrosomal protein of 19 kDa-like n=1 Tax=Myotis davidii TaxID=225400 RepID=UPI0007679919|nr:PREDICTED: LOW QUALITY PROTEIN: centrosomal protein of 19 kDa-like [Myotis davidii]